MAIKGNSHPKPFKRSTAGVTVNNGLIKLSLGRALRSRLFVTVETVEDDIFIGTIKAVSFDQIRIDSGTQGRPKILDVDDIEEIILVNAANPHVSGRTSKSVTRRRGIQERPIRIDMNAPRGRRIVILAASRKADR